MEAASIVHAPSASNLIDCYILFMAPSKYLCHCVPHYSLLLQTANVFPLPSVLLTSTHFPCCIQKRVRWQVLFLKHHYKHVIWLPRFLWWLLRTMSRVWPGPQICYLSSQAVSFMQLWMLCASVLLTYDLSKCAQEAMSLWVLLMHLSSRYWGNCIIVIIITVRKMGGGWWW